MLEIIPSHWTKMSITQFLPLNELSLIVNEFGMDDFEYQKALPKRTALAYGIHVILKGKGTYLLGNKTFEAEEGDVLISMPGHMICYTPDAENPWKYFWILFNGKDADKLLENSDFTLENPVYKLKNTKEAFSIINRLLQKKQENRQFQLRTLSVLCDLFALINEERAYSKENRRLYKKSSYVQAAIRIIESRYCDPEFTVGDICKELAINQSYLCQLFREYANTTASRYLIEYRILQARTFLDRGDVNIKDAAIAVGYKDYNHFIKQFQQTIGMSPKQYRLHQKKNKKEHE